MKILISIGSSGENYTRAVERAGGVAYAAHCPEVDLSFDCLILAGGGDVEPWRYGADNCGSVEFDPTRDEAELALLDAFAQAGKPILGICRGHQMINVWAGGSLVQDLGEGNAIHRRVDADKVHKICAEGILRDLYGSKFAVNSAHHQAVAELGAGLRITARSADGVVEAMEHEGLPIFSVQFHPERMNGSDTEDGGAVFRWFLEQCK
jgi:putative glutamine amidotransferase